MGTVLRRKCRAARGPIAIGYAQCGVMAVVADIDEEGAAETVAAIAAHGGSAHAESLDVTKRSQCVDVANAMRRERGALPSGAIG